MYNEDEVVVSALPRELDVSELEVRNDGKVDAKVID